MHQALDAAIVGDSRRASDALDEIGLNSTPQELYGVCGGLAGGCVKALQLVHGDAYDPAAGDRVWFREAVPGANEADPYGAWAMRFLVAHANGDTAMTNALYRAAHVAGGRDLANSVACLLLLAADMARSTAEHLRQQHT
ncbi:hypothetical protein ACFY0G_02055 [Streptomyces sp. NPDC001552]|uniref:hypothetical protein n=1 Tax=Streptomyces sp. NPDC001552 TaxID=3364587 RepID=UPI0036AC1427